MKFTLLIVAAILAYTAAAAPVADSDNGKADLEPIGISVAPNLIAPAPKIPERTRTDLPFDSHPDNLEDMPHISESHIEPYDRNHNHLHDSHSLWFHGPSPAVKSPNPDVSAKESSSLDIKMSPRNAVNTESVSENDTNAIEQEAEAVWVEMLKTIHPGSNLTDAGLYMIAEPYLPSACCIPAGEFCKVIEDQVKEDRFNYNPHDFKKSCEKLHGNFKKIFDAIMKQQGAELENSIDKRQEASYPKIDQVQGEQICASATIYQMLSPPGSVKGLSPKDLQNMCDTYKAQQRIRHKPSSAHLSLSNATSSNITATPKARPGRVWIHKRRTVPGEVQRFENEAFGNPLNEALSRLQPRKDKVYKNASEYEILTADRFNLVCKGPTWVEWAYRTRWCKPFGEGQSVSPSNSTLPRVVTWGTHEIPVTRWVCSTRKLFEFWKLKECIAVYEPVNPQSNAMVARHVRRDETLFPVSDYECKTPSSWDRIFGFKPFCEPAIILVQNPKALEDMEIWKYVPGEKGTSTRIVCKKLNWFMNFFVWKKGRQCNVIHVYPVGWNGTVAQVSEASDRKLLLDYGFNSKKWIKE